MRGCYHVNYKCSLPTAAADEGLLSCEWEVVPYTRQPLMRGYYHVNERLSRTHGSHWWGAGILWMSEELSDCALHTAERRSEAGAACLHCGFFRAASAATWDPFAPASAFGSPHCHGRGREKPGWCLVLQVRRWEECGHLVGTSSSPESRRSTAGQRADGLPLRNVILTWTLQRSSHEACPRMSEPKPWAVIV